MARFMQGVNGVMRGVELEATYYDDSVVISVSTPAGTSITLPSGQTYIGDELEVWWNGQSMEYLIDYVYVGSGAKTQIQFTFDLEANDRIRFKIQTL